MYRTNKEWYNYIAAFFDGEGCATISVLKKEQSRRCYTFNPAISMSQKTVSVLYQIEKILGFGVVYKRRNGCFEYQIRTYKSILEFIELIRPYSIVKINHLGLLKKLIHFKKMKTRNHRYTEKELKTMLEIRDSLHELNGGKIKYSSKQILRSLNCK